MAVLLDYVVLIARLELVQIVAVWSLVLCILPHIYRVILYQSCREVVAVCIYVYCISFLLAVNMLRARLQAVKTQRPATPRMSQSLYHRPI